MRSKKTQVTMFIIIGIVLLFVFIILFYFKNTIERESIKKNIEDVSAIFAVRGKYHQYVLGCVELATKEGLFMVGMQGGVIYDHQVNGGKAISKAIDPYGVNYIPYEFQGNMYNVSYGIKKSELGSEYHPVIPFYPYGLTKLISNPKLINRYFKNSYGNYPRNPFTPLCDFHGKNKRGGSEAVSCETYDSRNINDLNSIQEYLERFIENRTMSCVRLEDLPELSKLDITKGDIIVNVTFGEKHVLVNMILPIHIKIGSFNSVIQLNNFETVYEVRLKKIHELITHLIEKDVNDIFFNIVNDASTVNNCKDITGGNSLCLKPGMNVKKKSNICFENGLCAVGNYDDVLIVTDYDSLLDGLPYVFNVAIQNRPPALDLIRKEIGTGSFYFDYVVSVGEKILIEPAGIDPDEDQHNFNGFMDNLYYYYNWKEEYDDIFLCPSGNCQYNDESKIQHIFTTSPRNWTTSQNYLDTRRIASYTTNEDDKGVHVLKVEVCDEGGLCDYQAVIIYVVNGTFVGGYNPYNDIPQGFTSLEDPYEFTSPIDENTYPGISLLYKWAIKDESGILVWTGDTTEPKMSVPASSYDINNIKTGVSVFFSESEQYSMKVDLYNSLNNNLVSGGNFDNFIDVKECLPHRSFDSPYPYNLGTDPFEANHSCCIGDPADPTQVDWGTIKDASNVCYTEIEYGCREDTNFGPTVEFTSNLCDDPRIICYDNGRGINNQDIYERKFERKCDGLRGNTCEGDMTETRTNIKQCDECQKCQYGGVNEPNCLPINFDESPICNPIYECTLGEGYPYSGNTDPYLPYKCQAACSDNACDTATNCECNSMCGAECEFNDERSYVWKDKECIYDCNNFEDSANLKFDCRFDETINTICSSPNPGATTIINYDGVDYKIGISDPSYTNSIDSKDPSYVTYCNSGDYCMFGVTCNGGGTLSTTGEYCPIAGTKEVVDGDDICYYGSSGTDLGCDGDGNCIDYDEWSISCNEGNPVYDGYCRDNDICYVPVCDSVLGWQENSEITINLSGTDYPASNGGFQLDTQTCYYDMKCSNSGWIAESESCFGSNQDGNFCEYNPSCTSSGCEFDKTLCKPDSWITGSTTCNKGNDCTLSGCMSRGTETKPDPCVDAECTIDGWICS